MAPTFNHQGTILSPLFYRPRQQADGPRPGKTWRADDRVGSLESASQQPWLAGQVHSHSQMKDQLSTCSAIVHIPYLGSSRMSLKIRTVHRWANTVLKPSRCSLLSETVKMMSFRLLCKVTNLALDTNDINKLYLLYDKKELLQGLYETDPGSSTLKSERNLLHLSGINSIRVTNNLSAG